MHTLHKYRFVSGFRLESLLPWPVLVFFSNLKLFKIIYNGIWLPSGSGHDGTKTNGIFPVFFILSVVCIFCCCFAQCLGSLLLYGQWSLCRAVYAICYTVAATPGSRVLWASWRMVWAASYYIGYIASYYGLLLHSDGMGELEGNECAFFTAPLLMRYKGQRPTPCLVPVLNTLQDILVVFVLEYTCCFVLFNK